jgi:hypothetical protein
VYVEAIGAEVENWIADELPRPVKRDVASASGLDELDALSFELFRRSEHVRPIVSRSNAEGNDRRMLEQEQLVGNAAGLALFDEPFLEVERVRVLERSEPAYF